VGTVVVAALASTRPVVEGEGTAAAAAAGLGCLPSSGRCRLDALVVK
jgi:hypothetical protein